MFPDWLAGSLFTGAISGIVTYGGIIVKLQWMRRDIDLVMDDIRRAHERLDKSKCSKVCGIDHE